MHPSGPKYLILASERGNFKLFGFICLLYLRKFELFGARLLKKRVIIIFRKLGVPYLGVLIIGILLFRVLFIWVYVILTLRAQVPNNHIYSPE